MEEFLDHIKIAYKLLTEDSRVGNNPFVKTWLAESRGIPSQLDEMIDKILAAPVWEKAYKIFQEQEGKGVVKVSFDMWRVTKDVDRNFLGPGSYLELYFRQTDWTRRPNCYGAYSGAVTAKWNKEACYLEDATIVLQCATAPNFDIGVIKRYARGILAHELVHAYEDFNRRALNTKTLTRALADRNYTSPNEDPNMDVVNMFTYVMDPAEQKAFIASSIDDIKSVVRSFRKAGKLDRFENIRNFEYLLKYTQFWPIYSDLRNFVEHTQWDRLPEHQQRKLLDKYNWLVGGNVNSRRPETYNQLVKKIKNRWYKFDQDLKVKVGQAAADALHSEYPIDPNLKENKTSLFDSLINQAY